MCPAAEQDFWRNQVQRIGFGEMRGREENQEALIVSNNLVTGYILMRRFGQDEAQRL